MGENEPLYATRATHRLGAAASPVEISPSMSATALHSHFPGRPRCDGRAGHFRGYLSDIPDDRDRTLREVIARIPDGGAWRAHGRRDGRTAGPASRPRSGTTTSHVVVDDHSRLAYARGPANEKRPTWAAFLPGPAAAFAGHGIRSPSHDRQRLNYRRSNDLRTALNLLDATTCPHPAAQPLAERESRTLQPHPARELGLPTPIHLEQARLDALQPWLGDYNYRSSPHRLKGQPPISRVSPTCRPSTARRLSIGASRQSYSSGGKSSFSS